MPENILKLLKCVHREIISVDQYLDRLLEIYTRGEIPLRVFIEAIRQVKTV